MTTWTTEHFIAADGTPMERIVAADGFIVSSGERKTQDAAEAEGAVVLEADLDEDLEDEPTPPATLDEDVTEAIRNGSLGSEEIEILPTPPSRSADNGWWVEVRVWIRDRDEG